MKKIIVPLFIAFTILLTACTAEFTNSSDQAVSSTPVPYISSTPTSSITDSSNSSTTSSTLSSSISSSNNQSFENNDWMNWHTEFAESRYFRLGENFVVFELGGEDSYTYVHAIWANDKALLSSEKSNFGPVEIKNLNDDLVLLERSVGTGMGLCDVFNVNTKDKYKTIEWYSCGVAFYLNGDELLAAYVDGEKSYIENEVEYPCVIIKNIINNEEIATVKRPAISILAGYEEIEFNNASSVTVQYLKENSEIVTETISFR